MTDDAGLAILTTIGEVGGVTGVVALTIAILIRCIKKNGCTCRLYTCTGQTLAEVDCEEGAPTERYTPHAPSDQVMERMEEGRVIRPRDVPATNSK